MIINLNKLNYSTKPLFSNQMTLPKTASSTNILVMVTNLDKDIVTNIIDVYNNIFCLFSHIINF